jgi:ATP-dependent RNA helicase RhlE
MCMTIESFKFNPTIAACIKAMGYLEPTPIQTQALPPVLGGRDVLGQAQTGTGKTAAFVLPILQRLLDRPHGPVRALIVAPTRELSEQTHVAIGEMGRRTGIRSVTVYGGVGMSPQVEGLRRGADIVVACPGRLLDHIEHRTVDLSHVEVLVLDEADRMLDMGFLPDIRRVLGHLPKKRRTFFFSATLPAPIVALSKEMLENPVALNIERPSAPAAGITHTVYPVAHELKSTLLIELLKQGGPRSVLAFTRTKHRADRLARFLETRGVACDRIHGNRSQAQRTEALTGFKQGKFRVLVATDIAARGIDVEALGLVVNFDVPHLPEDYIHRVGRTARVEASGVAWTLVTPDDEPLLYGIERLLGKKIERARLPGFDYDEAVPDWAKPSAAALRRRVLGGLNSMARWRALTR